jgi:hypothetical protein
MNKGGGLGIKGFFKSPAMKEVFGGDPSGR